MKPFIIIVGNIGVGKTTLARIISDVFGFQLYEEKVENNPYLPLFYRDMKTYSFKLQRFFLFHRVVDHEVARNSSQPCLQDRSVYEDAEIFAKSLYEQGHLSHEDYKRYRRFYDDVLQDLTPPDLLVYLRATPKTLRERIKKRARHYEKELLREDNPYLERLNALYEDWIRRYPGKKVIIETDKLNIIDNPQDLNLIIKEIHKNMPEENAHITDF